VTAIETEDGTRWAESKIKSLSGGDKIAARYMRQDFFEFLPEFKLLVAGNHKPGLRSVDEAMRRRLHLIPFTVTIPKSDQDPALAEKLRGEYRGILQWAIEGCLEWQHQGLNPPAVVRNATDQYLAAEDAIGRWIEERCVIDRLQWTAGSLLYRDFSSWCEATGELRGTQKRFTQALESRGFSPQRTRDARGFAGIALRSGLGVTDVTGAPISDVYACGSTPNIGCGVTCVTSPEPLIWAAGSKAYSQSGAE
jgi:putative DNA primase/helicase